MKKVRIVFTVMIIILIFLPMLLKLFPINIKSKDLAGMKIEALRPIFSYESFKNGEFQSGFIKYFNENLPLRSEYVRLANQIYYSFFNKSYMYSNNLIIGKNEQIYEKGYLDYYVKNNLNDKELAELTSKLEKTQKKLKENGKTFILLITPNKASIMPEFVPTPYQPFMYKKDLPYERFRRLLNSSEINFVDGQEITQKAKESSDNILFSKGGTHWNTYAASLTLNQLILKINKLTEKNLQEIKIEKILKDNIPIDNEDDIYKLLNIIKKPSYECLHPQWEKNTIDDSMSTTFITGSFSGMIVQVIRENMFDNKKMLFDPIDYSFYYRRSRLFFEKKDVKELITFDKLNENEWKKAILDNDLIILELNSSMPVDHVNAFIDAVEANL